MPDDNSAAVSEYVQSIASELAKLAQSNDLGVQAYLADMLALQAERDALSAGGTTPHKM